jgi:hypothetical protein
MLIQLLAKAFNPHIQTLASGPQDPENINNNHSPSAPNNTQPANPILPAHP